MLLETVSTNVLHNYYPFDFDRDKFKFGFLSVYIIMQIFKMRETV